VAHPQTHAQTQRGQFPQTMGESTGRGKHRIDADADNQRHAAAEAVGEEAKQNPPGGGGNEGDRSEQAGLRGGELQLAQEFADDHGVEGDVHAIEHPA